MHNPRATMAIFDFDGTLTQSDSFFSFLNYSATWRKKLGSALLIFPAALSFFGVLSKSRAKEMTFSHFFRGMNADSFNALCADYSLNILPSILRPQAINKVLWHRERKHKLIIVSASLENWITPWAKQNGFDDVIATKAEIKDGKISGCFKMPNCSGNEKKRRFLEQYPQKDNYYIYAYGDSKNDKYLFSMANEVFYKKF